MPVRASALPAVRVGADVHREAASLRGLWTRRGVRGEEDTVSPNHSNTADQETGGAAAQ